MINNKYPTTKPSLNLDFANTKSLDPRITFRRGTPGTYYDGVTHAKAEENLIDYSEDFANAYWTKSNCSITSDSVDAPDGTVSAADKIVENTATSTHQLSVGAADILNKTYTLSYFVKAAGRNSCRISFSGQGSAVFNISTGVVIINEFISASINAVGNDWYRVSATVIKTNTNADIFIGPALDDGTLSYQGDGTSGIYLWGAQLEQRDTVTSYTSTNGTPITKYQPKLMTAAADQARFDHDPITGESKGLLIEEQRTNLISYSEDFSAWLDDNNSVISERFGYLSPSGEIVYKLKPTINLVSTGTYKHSNLGSNSAGTYTYSVYVKSCGYNYAWIGAWNGSVYNTVIVDLTDGSLVNAYMNNDGNLSGETVEFVENGWYRVSFVVANTAASFLSIGCLSDPSTDVDGTHFRPVFSGNGYDGIFAWGAQVEAGSFATSYIKTTGASATRSADNASITGENFSSWYRQDEGSIYCESYSYDDYVQRILNISDGSSNNRIVISAINSEQLLVKNNANTEISIDSGSYTVGEFLKQGTAYKDDSFFVTLGGNSGSSIDRTDSTSDGSVPKSLNKLNIGCSEVNSFYLNGHIKKLAYYPQRLTNEQLQNLTK